MKQKHLIIVSLLILSIASNIKASLLIQPVDVTTTMGEYFPAERIINQSGLSAGYTSLVDDFDSYMASNPTANPKALGSFANTWGSSSGVRSGILDFDLGGNYLIDSLALWNLFDDISSVQTFNLSVDDNSSFSSPTIIGSYQASNTLGALVPGGFFFPDPIAEAQIFSFTQTPASFVRLEIVNTWSETSYHASLNEIAFGGTDAIPEPAVMGLMAIFGGGIVFARRFLTV